MCGVDTKETYLEILCFRQFYKHFVFVEDEEGNRNKRIKKYFEVLAVVDVGCGENHIKSMAIIKVLRKLYPGETA
jgi:hypothetical protein